MKCQKFVRLYVKVAPVDLAIASPLMTVINLNRFRKQKQREAKQQRADENARRHGRTKAERQQEASRRKQLDDQLDGARLRDTDDELEQP